MEHQVSGRHNECKRGFFICWRKPFEDEIDVKSQLTAASICSFCDTKPVDSVVMPAVIFKSFNHLSRPMWGVIMNSSVTVGHPELLEGQLLAEPGQAHDICSDCDRLAPETSKRVSIDFLNNRLNSRCLWKWLVSMPL